MQKKSSESGFLKLGVVGAMLIGVFVFNSCSLDSESNYTPEIMQSTYFTNQHGDTLKLKVINSEYVMDTMHVGDTISMQFLLNAVTNNLKAFNIKQSADSVSRVILPSRLSLDSIFTTGSDYSKGLFVFKPNVQYAKFPFKYYAMKTSMTGKITLTISSDANFGSTVGASNVRSVEIKTPIKPEIVSY